MAKIAGIESMANIMSELSIATSASPRGVR
jgi:hypothetical protein